MTSTAASAPTQTAAPAKATQPIPFRPEADSVAADATGALLLVSASLAACLALLWLAKKKGWLDRWIPGASAATPQASLRVERALRLSPRTTLYRVCDEEGRYLVVESSVNARITVLADTSGDTGHV